MNKIVVHIDARFVHMLYYSLCHCQFHNPHRCDDEVCDDDVQREEMHNEAVIMRQFILILIMRRFNMTRCIMRMPMMRSTSVIILVILIMPCLPPPTVTPAMTPSTRATFLPLSTMPWMHRIIWIITTWWFIIIVPISRMKTFLSYFRYVHPITCLSYSRLWFLSPWLFFLIPTLIKNVI